MDKLDYIIEKQIKINDGILNMLKGIKDYIYTLNTRVKALEDMHKPVNSNEIEQGVA